MNKRVLWALILIGLVVLVLIFNGGKISVDLLLVEVSTLKSLILLGFVGIGVIIGVLLK